MWNLEALFYWTLLFSHNCRLCPLLGGNARFVQEDVVLSGYKVPSGVCSRCVFGQQQSYEFVLVKVVLEELLQLNSAKEKMLKRKTQIQ